MGISIVYITLPIYFSFVTPYLEYLLAQINEVLENYVADGIFMDITGVRMCCCNKCMKDMIA